MFPLPVGETNLNVRALARWTRETRTGSTSATWDLANRPVNGFEMIYKNGILLQPGGGADYTISGNRVTLGVAPIVGDRLTAVYYYRAN